MLYLYLVISVQFSEFQMCVTTFEQYDNYGGNDLSGRSDDHFCLSVCQFVSYCSTETHCGL